jgi:hypothetical protein
VLHAGRDLSVGVRPDNVGIEEPDIIEPAGLDLARNGEHAFVIKIAFEGYAEFHQFSPARFITGGNGE